MLARSLTSPPATAAAKRSVRGGQVAGHVAAIAVAGHRQPGGIGDPLGDQLIDGLEEVPLVGRSPSRRAAAVKNSSP